MYGNEKSVAMKGVCSDIINSYYFYRIVSFFDKKYAHPDNFDSWYNHMIIHSPHSGNLIVEFARNNAPEGYSDYMAQYATRRARKDFSWGTRCVPFDPNRFRVFVDPEKISDYDREVKSITHPAEMDPSGRLGDIREKIVLSSPENVYQAIDIITNASEKVCRVFKSGLFVGDKFIKGELAKEILGSYKVNGVNYDIYEILSYYTPLEIEMFIRPGIERFLTNVKEAKINDLSTYMSSKDLLSFYLNLNQLNQDDKMEMEFCEMYAKYSS